jgi:hypothetical protein
MADRAKVKSAIKAGGGMLRLEPSRVPRSFMIPGGARGVKIENLSATDPLVILKHFGPGNPDAEG